MSKLKKNESGLGVVLGLALLVIVAVILAAWYVGRNNKPGTEGNDRSQNTSTNDEDRVSMYQDDLVSFTNPGGWKVKRNDNKNLPGTKSIEIASPKVQLPLESHAEENVRLRLNIFLNSDGGKLKGCTECGVFGEVVALDNPNIPDAKLIFTEAGTRISTHDNKADTIALVNSKSIRVGDKSPGVVRAGGKNFIIWTDLDISTGQVGANFTTVAALQETQTYKDLVGILNSLQLTE